MEIRKYENIFHYQLNFFSSNARLKFYQTQYSEIKPAINKTISFVDKYDFCDQQEDMKRRAVFTLPFMITLDVFSCLG